MLFYHSYYLLLYVHCFDNGMAQDSGLSPVSLTLYL